MQHYNELLIEPWQQLGYDVVYQPSCLVPPYDEQCWNIRFPEVQWTDRTLIIMHCQDFLTVRDQGCAEIDQIEKHFGEHSNRVIIVHWDLGLDHCYPGPCHLVHFPTHSYEIINRLKIEPYWSIWQGFRDQSRDRTWQCLNGTERAHRRCVYSWLRDFPGGVVNLGRTAPLPENDYRGSYVWDEHAWDLNERNFILLSWLYFRTRINIVTETIYSGDVGIISEKTLYAFLAGQIPIVIGHRGIVAQCRGLGFDMFDDIVDTSYDTLPDHERWQAALELNKHLLIHPPDMESLTTRMASQTQWVLTWPRRMIWRYHQRVLDINDFLTKP
jgi:hypothetical protein